MALTLPGAHSRIVAVKALCTSVDLDLLASFLHLSNNAPDIAAFFFILFFFLAIDPCNESNGHSPVVTRIVDVDTLGSGVRGINASPILHFSAFPSASPSSSLLCFFFSEVLSSERLRDPRCCCALCLAFLPPQTCSMSALPN